MRRYKSMAAMVLLMAVAGSSVAQETPLTYGTTNGISNEFGALLPGRHPHAEAWGLEPVTGAMVQILHATDGVVYPPAADGSPSSTNNVVIHTTRIGEGVDGALPISGQFGGSLGSFRRSAWYGEGPKIFARVFNQISAEASSFYGDSSVFRVPVYGDAYGRFLVDITATDQPLDDGDDDNDGMHNSWEKSYGTDAGNPDSDGDGVRDGDEMLAGTDALDETSFLAVVELLPYGSRDLMVMWESSPGTMYQLQLATNDLMEADFQPVNDVLTATGSVVGTVVTNGQDITEGHFRVRVITP